MYAIVEVMTDLEEFVTLVLEAQRMMVQAEQHIQALEVLVTLAQVVLELIAPGFVNKS